MRSYINGLRSNYDKTPYIEVKGYENSCIAGWKEICKAISNQLSEIESKNITIAVETYLGVNDDEIVQALKEYVNPDHFFMAHEAMKSEQKIYEMTWPDVTDDDIFGYLTRLNMIEFFDTAKLEHLAGELKKKDGLSIVYGPGATLVARNFDLLIYADMPRWEGQLRFRRDEATNLGVNNLLLKASLQYKRAYFVDWRVCDRHKRKLMRKIDFVLETVVPNKPNMITGDAMLLGLEETSKRPFRVVPFFDTGPWGGQWMKAVCDLDQNASNYAWCFDCVPEENSLNLKFGEAIFEIPSINLVFSHPKAVLGEAVHGRFGDEFPIRFDFLDTMQGGNLSLQVHPITEYIQEKFGVQYTQDESYYILDNEEGAIVYLGLKEDVNPEEMISDLQYAHRQDSNFDPKKYVGIWPVKKHDHILIPAGTIHCSGSNCMVLEISATPYIFTFKIYDWGRMGLDGKPRPINIEHGKQVIQWDRMEKWVKENIMDQTEIISEGNGWVEERTGLHEREFIETRRHWFTKPVLHHTNGGVNVLNLVEGREVLVESPENRFEPFEVHYAETFIVPASVGPYTIRPYGESARKKCATIKAYVRTNS